MAQNNANDLNLSIDPDELKPLFTTNSFRHLLGIIFDWVIIIATIFLCVQYFNPLTYILAVIIIGARMHALAVLMHDATHYRFLKNRKWNDIATNVLSMYLLFTTIEKYRRNHLPHHNFLNTDEDPDWAVKMGVEEFTFPKTKRAFLGTIFSYLLLYKGMSDAFWFLKRFSSAKGKKKSTENKILPIAFYLVLATVLTLGGLWKYFLLFWVVPYFSTFFMFQYIRSVAEHFGEMEYDHLLTKTRSVKPTLVERFFCAPHHVGYHLEHHLYPGVPFYNLPKLHQLLMTDADYNKKAHITEGYISGLLNELGAPGVVQVEAN